MRTFLKLLGLFALLGIAAAIWPSYQLYEELAKAASEDPSVWEDNIAALEEKTRGLHDPGEGVVFIGSSSIRLWDSLVEDMAPLPVLQHGFGGAKLNDVLYYADRLVSAYRPRAVVVFAGTNDISPEAVKAPAVLLQTYQDFIARIRAEDPYLPVFFIAITPSPLRWSVWSVAQETNDMIAAWSAQQSGLYVIDTAGELLGADGQPDPANYIFDGLHLSDQGYAGWTRVIRPRLMAEFGASESPRSGLE